MSEHRDRGPFSTHDLATLTLFLLVLLNPEVSLDVRPTPSIPALTSRAGVPVLCVSDTASSPRVVLELQVSVWFQ